MSTATLPDASKMLSIPETAKWMGVSRSHVYNLIQSGELRFVNSARSKSGRTKMRVPVAAIEEFEAARTKRYPRRGPRASTSVAT